MIRKLIKEDRDCIRKILVDTKHFNEEEIDIALELIDVYLDVPKQKEYIIYVYANDETKKAEGYICYGRRPLTEATYDLYWIAVNPDIHGKGIGSKLVGFMEQDLKKMKGKLVLIETSGKDAYSGERKFYEKNGYIVQTVIKDFYRSGDDLFVFSKYI